MMTLYTSLCVIFLLQVIVGASLPRKQLLRFVAPAVDSFSRSRADPQKKDYVGVLRKSMPSNKAELDVKWKDDTFGKRLEYGLENPSLVDAPQVEDEKSQVPPSNTFLKARKWLRKPISPRMNGLSVVHH